MIKLFRIDERLIHGQVAIKWSRHTGVDRIIVANDGAAKSDVIQKTLKMAAPAEVKTVIKTVDEAIQLLKDPRCEAMKILFLVSNPEDAARVVAHISGISYINIGNYGRVAPEKPNMPRKRYSNNIYCDELEVKTFKELMNTGIQCIYQTTPDDSPEEITKIFD